VVGPLACHLLDRLNADPTNLFRRLQGMRAGRRAYLAKLEARALAEAAAAEAAEAAHPPAQPGEPSDQTPS
jgi:hypothetical protein